MKATVVRDGAEEDILAREIVPGDIVSEALRRSLGRTRSTNASQVIIEEGQTVPADARLICDYSTPDDFARYKELREKDEFGDSGDPDEKKDKDDDDEDAEAGEVQHEGHSIIATDQSAITGESLAVDKYMGDIVYYTTGCKRGKAYAVATTSAKHSFVGRTASLVSGATDQGHFKAIMNNIGISLLVLVVFFIVLSWIGGFFRHLKIATPEDSSINLLHYVLILLIVGVPVGLPVVTTTTLAVGAAYLAQQKAIVQKLTAIESLAVRSTHLLPCNLLELTL